MELKLYMLSTVKGFFKEHVQIYLFLLIYVFFSWFLVLFVFLLDVLLIYGSSTKTKFQLF